MDTHQLFVIFLTVFLFVLRVVVRYINNRHKPLSERLLGEDAIDGFLIASIFGIVTSIAFSTLPNIKSVLGEINAAVEDSPEYMILQTLTKSRRAVEEITDPGIRNIFNNFLHKETDKYKAAISSIANSRIILHRESTMRFAESAIKAANKSINAASYTAPNCIWWLTSDGRAYALKNEDAIKRGVQIKRIFIYADDTEYKKLEPVIAQQKKAGIIVYSALLSSLPKDWTHDLLIVDQALVASFSTGADSCEVEEIKASVDAEDIKRENEVWEDTLRLSKLE